MLNELLNKDDNVHDSLISLVKDKFGNYVVQKMIEHAPEKQRQQIIEHIVNNSELKKKKDAFSKHVFSYIEKNGYINSNNLNNNVKNNENNQNNNVNNISENNNSKFAKGMNMNMYKNNSENNVLDMNNFRDYQYFNNNNSDLNNKYFPGNLNLMNNMNNNDLNNYNLDRDGQEE